MDIPCQNCRTLHPNIWRWFVCDQCGFRVCPPCLTRHKGPHGYASKCSQCANGRMKEQQRV